MASKTGIALLSVYDDEDDDDMEEDLNEEQQQQQDDQQDEEMEQNYEEDDSILKTDKNALIVDYGRDEVTMSPEAELEKEPGTVRVVSLSTRTTFQSSVYVETSQTVTMHVTVRDSNTVEDVEDRTISGGVDSKDVDPLDEFLPSPPEEKCSDELQDRINKFLALKRVGKSFNAEVRNKKNYRNPDFLLHAVRYQDIDQIGSCFSKDVFDPHGYDKSDYYDEIEADMKHEAERKEQERKKSPKVEFHTGGMHLGTVPTAQKVGLSAPGVSTGGAGGLPSVPVAVDAVTRDGRKNKKSKWDKVDGDQRIFFPSRGRIPSLTLGHMLQTYPLLMLVLDILPLRNRDNERQKIKDRVKGEEDELFFVFHGDAGENCVDMVPEIRRSIFGKHCRLILYIVNMKVTSIYCAFKLNFLFKFLQSGSGLWNMFSSVMQ